MHVHQKKAFQFLWQNIGGSMKPTLREAESKRRGGCVISRAPRAGKTFLIIAFLISYLKLFPGKKPLVLTPKITLHTWYKEFIKWEISMPMYLIHGREFADRKYMAKALREGSGILILDEGHNPRSTKSRLRKDPNYRRKSKTAEKARHLLESRARKMFLDNIAKKIDSGIGKERMRGLNMLREITNGFIDVYESANFENVPGLQIYTLLMHTTHMQREILLKLHTRMVECSGYPLELELFITLGSIHPWLVKQPHLDVKIGSKVKFVLSLVFRVMEREKVLIFCHNHPPVRLLVELFELLFKWEKDREVLLLNLDLFEHGKVIDKFENPGGASKVLLASITTCAEGISLTAASRVVFLDSEWNPSKTKQAIARAFRPGQKKMVYVYQLLATGTLEEDKYQRTTWKEWVSSMIFSEAFEENPSH
ncbi:SNF2 domain-containing protein CLASSY 1, partial [Mucuna pruriens]